LLSTFLAFVKDVIYWDLAWWCTLVIPALWRQRKEDHKFEQSLGYIAKKREDNIFSSRVSLK
jgi:hypothetical protein